MANDLLSALRTYLSKVGSGEKSPQEVAAALNQWARESGDAIKKRIDEEVESKVKRMGFAKQSDLERLERELEELKRRAGGSAKTSPAKKSVTGKSPTGKSSTGKSSSSGSKKPASKSGKKSAKR